MTAAIGWYDIQHVRGKTLRMQFTVKDGATPRDLTGYAARFELFARQGDTVPVATKTSAAQGGIVISPGSGVLQLTVEASVFTSIATPGAFYRLTLTDTTAEDLPLLQGACLLA